MARKGKTTRRRRSKIISLLNVAESYSYLNILTQGLAGTGPVNFITGKGDASMLSVYDQGLDTTSMSYKNPDGVVSLSDIISSPEGSFMSMSAAFKQNYQQMAVNSILTGITFRVGKRLLRRPISNVNKNLFKPLGAGFKL